MKLRVGALVSGRGSNLEAILRSIRSRTVRNAEVSVVISNKPDVPALQIAKDFAVPSEVLPSAGVAGDRWEYDKLVVQSLKRHGVTPEEGLVVLAGFNRIISPEFVKLYANRILNIHPAILPAFPGLNAQKQALDYGAKVAGCTVHFVVPEVDAGPIVIQKTVRVEEDDDVESLSARILKQEHKIYPEAVNLFAEGKLEIVGRRVVVRK